MPLELLDTQGQPFTLDAIFAQSAVTVLTTFRGPWCMFCRGFLKGVQAQQDQFKASGVQIVAVGADSPADLAKLSRELHLTFPLLSDAGLSTHRELRAPSEGNSRISKQYPNKAFLQPSVFLFDRDGKQFFQWIHKPGVLNLGGALFRMDPGAILEEARKRPVSH